MGLLSFLKNSLLGVGVWILGFVLFLAAAINGKGVIGLMLLGLCFLTGLYFLKQASRE